MLSRGSILGEFDFSLKRPNSPLPVILIQMVEGPNSKIILVKMTFPLEAELSKPSAGVSSV
jgi:hypothetical protein